MPNDAAKTHFAGPVDSAGGFTIDTADAGATELLNITDTAGNIIKTSAGASASKYIRIKFGGTVYKIALLADS